MHCELGGYRPEDAQAVNEVALSAFRQYRNEYRDWEGFSRRIADMASLADSAEIILAKHRREVVGAVAYVGPGEDKASFFPPEWPILRMLVVQPKFRGRGAGRMLAEECIGRALRDRAPVIALHTSHIMREALRMYQQMGFEFLREAPAIHGVPYGIYIKRLDQEMPNNSKRRDAKLFIALQAAGEG